MILLLAGAALAADLVLFDGMEPDEAAAQVKADAGLTATPAGLSKLLLGEPITARPGEARGCAGAPIAADALAEAARRARSRLDYVDPAGAIAEIDAALERAPCLSGPADAGALARLYFLRGVASHAAGRPAEATADFVQARVFAPQQGWDPAFQPDALALFEAATPPEARARLDVYPPRGDAVLIDGRGGAGAVAPGVHLVQALGEPISGAWLRVDGDAEVLLPSLVADRDVRGVADPALAGPLARAIAAALPTPTDVYVALPRGTWRITSGDAAFTQVARHRPSRRKVAAPLTLAAGAAMALGGGALYAVSYDQGHRAWETGDASTGATWSEYQEALPAYAAAKQRMGVGAGLAGAGALVAGVGLTMQLGGSR